MNLENKNVLVYGSGLSGMAAADLLASKGAKVTIFDEDATKTFAETPAYPIVLGTFSEADMAALDLVVMSPGVPLDGPLVKRFYERGIEVIGEIELAFQVGKGDVLAITGTNGKTTTTSLLGEIMKRHSKNTYVVGNIGHPYTLVANQTDDESIIVAETSSFQLETIKTFHPRVSAILNFAPDHLDRHHTMEEYVACKERISENQTADDFIILNYDDPITRAFADVTKAQVLFFSSTQPVPKGVHLDGYEIISNIGEEEAICGITEMQILGKHNYENAMAAIAMALAYGVDSSTVRDAVLAFKGVEHRIEFVEEIEHVAFYNDSKGTNPDAAIKGIQAMNRPTILIGGGYDKAADYTDWINAFEGKCKKLVLLGATREKIAATCEACGFHEYVLVDSFEEAVETAIKESLPGDAVLLSPACASWGMFKNYEERGRVFKELVFDLGEKLLCVKKSSSV